MSKEEIYDVEILPKSSPIYQKRDIRVRAWKFNGKLRENGKWLIPDWVLEAFKLGTLYYRNSDHAVCILDTENVDNDLCSEDLYIRHEGVPLTRIHFGDYITIDENNTIESYSDEEFNKIYVNLEYSQSLKRVDLRPKYSKENILEGTWIKILPESKSDKESGKITICCSTCGYSFRSTETQEVKFISIIRSKHFCTNCGSIMLNSSVL